MASPRVTVVVPAYNAEDYIEDCLRSISAQSFENFVCKVYDDGSEDSTGEIAKRFASRDKRFQYIPGVNLGTPRRVAVAYSEVTSEFFCQVDADDLIEKDALSITVDILSRCPEHIGVVYSDYQRIKSDGSVDPEDPHFEGRCRHGFSMRQMQRTGFCAFQFRLIRTSAYEASRKVDTSLETGEDFDLVLKLSEVTQFVHVPKKLYKYRQHASQTSRKNPTKLEMLCKRMMEKSQKRKSNPALVVVVQYNGPQDVFSIQQWAQQQVSVDILLAVIVNEVDDFVLRCQEYSHHRMEMIVRKKRETEESYAYIASRMVRNAQTFSFPEPLVPTPGVVQDLFEGRSVPVFDLEPLSSWLLRAGSLQFSVLKALAGEESALLGDGPLGTSALYRLA